MVLRIPQANHKSIMHLYTSCVLKKRTIDLLRRTICGQNQQQLKWDLALKWQCT